jgi:hypothetical protein
MTHNQLVASEEPGSFPRDHNQPPLEERIEEELALLWPRQAALLERAATAKIASEEDAAKVIDLGQIMRAFEQDTDRQREEMKRPYLQAARLIDAKFGAIIQPVARARAGEDGRSGLRGMLTTYTRRVEAEKQAERDRLQAEQRQREAEAEAARRAAENKRTGSEGIADELAVLQAEEAAAAAQRKADAIRPDEPIRSNLGAARLHREITFKLVDVRKAAGWIIKQHGLKGQLEQAIRTILGKHLRALGVDMVERGVDIPGVEAGIEKVAGVR